MASDPRLITQLPPLEKLIDYFNTNPDDYHRVINCLIRHIKELKKEAETLNTRVVELEEEAKAEAEAMNYL